MLDSKITSPKEEQDTENSGITTYLPTYLPTYRTDSFLKS
jgi:hypothetical protein